MRRVILSSIAVLPLLSLTLLATTVAGTANTPTGGQATGSPVGDVHPNNVTAAPADYFAALGQLRDKLKAEPELVILFNDAIKGADVRRLVEFGESLGIPVKYVALVDYSNSRGASSRCLLLSYSA